MRACEVLESLEALCLDAVEDDDHEGDAFAVTMTQEESWQHQEDVVVVSSDDATMTQSRLIH